MSGIEYASLNEELSEEELGTFVELLARLVRSSGGGVNGSLWVVNEDLGERMQIHLDAHDVVLCEMHRLEAMDNAVGDITV